MSGSRDLPAIEGSCMGGMSGMSRRAFSYDDNLEAPMPTLPPDMSINNLWRRPIIPERKFSNLTEEEGATVVSSSQTSVTDTAPIRSSGVVKTKASSIIMSSLITKQTHDSVYKFEQKAGLTDTSYTPHKGLTAEETQYHHRMPDSFQKMQIQSMHEVKEEKHISSAQSTPSNTPQSSPKQKRRSWFSSTGSELSVGSNTSMDVIGADAAAAAAALTGGGGGGVVERWSVFGPRHVDQGSESTTTAGFALQAHRGAQKPSAIDVMKAQATRLADDNTAQKVAPPVMEIPTVEGRKRRPHKLKPRDMNILAPSGF